MWGDYLDVICLHMEAVRRRDIKRLLMSLPPNTLKSTIISVCFPAWTWATNPSERFLFASNDGPLASRDASAMRELLESKWYQQSFRPTWRLKDDQDEKTWFANTAGGHRISYSLGAKVTGKKGDILIVDDPNDAKKVHSPVARKAVTEWYDQAFSGRHADERTSPHVICGQRVHKGDLIGHCLAKGGWDLCRLSEEFDPADVSETKVWRDGRTIAGQWLRPDRFGPAEKRDALGRMGSRGYETQHNLRPQDLEGNTFRKAWFKLTTASPGPAVRVRYWDKAHTQDGGCYTAGVLLARTYEGLWYVEDVVREQHSAMMREKLILNTAKTDRSRYGHVEIVVEQEPAGGKESAEATVRMLAGFQARIDPASRDKEVRALPFAAQAEVGNVFVMEAPWTAEYLEELNGFPDAKFADQVDATSGAFNWISAHYPTGGDECPVSSGDGVSVLDTLPDHTFR